jgi:hypothetical protein
VRVFSNAGAEWILDRRVLVPLNDAPVAATLSSGEASRLLAESGAWFLRYNAALSPLSTGWYYVICDECPDLANLSKGARYDVRTALKTCRVERVEATWLAENGFECYAAAQEGRDRATKAASSWKPTIAGCAETHELWGVFDNRVLAGYCGNYTCGPWVHHSFAYYHPAHLRNRIAYALVRVLQEEYVERRRMILCNGTRTLAHDSQYNRFLLKLGFREQHCALGLAYKPWVAAAVGVAYPLRGLLRLLPRSRPVTAVRAVITLEEIRRSQTTRASCLG